MCQHVLDEVMWIGFQMWTVIPIDCFGVARRMTSGRHAACAGKFGSDLHHLFGTLAFQGPPLSFFSQKPVAALELTRLVSSSSRK